MPTALTFSNYQVLSNQPFSKNGKLYLKVKHPTTGNERDVRWYTEAEFNKLYSKKAITKDGFDGLKEARGFSKGPILIIRNCGEPSDIEWLNHSNARYATDVGWYIVSTETLPSDAPPRFRYLLLTWDEFRNGDDRHMKDAKTLKALLDSKEKKGEYVLQ